MNESYVCIPIPTSLFLELANFLKEEGSDRDPVRVVRTAIDYWIDNASWKKEDLLPETIDDDHGYTWKEVFLPSGTSIRMKYKGEFYYAKIVGDQMIYQDKAISPSEFANTVANSNRNAWRDLEIKRPTDKAWREANTIRSKEKMKLSELFG